MMSPVGAGRQAAGVRRGQARQAFQDAVKRAGSLEAMDEAKQVTRGYS